MTALVNPVDPEKIRKKLIAEGLIVEKKSKDKDPEHRKIFNKKNNFASNAFDSDEDYDSEDDSDEESSDDNVVNAFNN